MDEDKLQKAHAIIRRMRRRGDDRLLWALEFYPAPFIYLHLLKLGYVWVKLERKWLGEEIKQ
jgi:hypothetical protein